MERAVFSLIQVANSIKKTLKERYHASYWVKAELYKVNLTPSGHAFPELVQREGGKVLASMSGIIWKTNFDRIRRVFEQTVKEPLDDGKEVLMEVRIDYHEVYGLTLHILDLDPAYSLGALHKLRLDTLKALSNLGILQKNQGLKFPIPKRIALISAASSKGLSDFMSVIQRTQGTYGIETFLFNSQIQGNQGAKSMVASLKRIEKVKDFFDVVVIVRGGGAEVGLSCYDDLNLCKEIALFPLPVLCGIGHSTNLTAAEMVCYSHAITPSELAHQVVSHFQIQSELLTQQGIKIQLAWNNALNYASQRRQLIAASLVRFVYTRIRFEKDRTVNHERAIGYLTPAIVRYSVQQFKGITRGLADNGGRQIQHGAHDLWKIQHRLLHQGERLLTGQRKGLDGLEKQIQLLSPEAVLSRGSAIVKAKEKIIDDPKKIKRGEKIKIHFYKGTGNATMD
ncbi:MAG: exodeoxyribonuclease VII large subunit [Flavobacteriales bacterium]